jgi:Fe-Mn family superoxide dismutase
MRDIITLLEDKSKEDYIEIVPLSYSDGDLAPVLSKESMKFHYGKLAKGYADKFNHGIGDPEFQYAGYFLHNIFFTQFRAPRRNNIPNGPIANLIKAKYKTFTHFKDHVLDQALQLQGSGWIYLSRDGSIKTIHNHEVRPNIIILLDLWEHSFQMDYGEYKEKYIENIWKIINWNVINTRYMEPYGKK